MTIHSSILAWKIAWTEQPGGLQSMGSQGFGRNTASLESKVDYPPQVSTAGGPWLDPLALAGSLSARKGAGVSQARAYSERA